MMYHFFLFVTFDLLFVKYVITSIHVCTLESSFVHRCKKTEESAVNGKRGEFGTGRFQQRFSHITSPPTCVFLDFPTPVRQKQTFQATGRFSTYTFSPLVEDE